MATDNEQQAALRKQLHPRLWKWFRSTYPGFTHAQLLCVPAILERESILLTSPTGSGKTLAGFLGIFDFLLRKLDAQSRAHAVAIAMREAAIDVGEAS